MRENNDFAMDYAIDRDPSGCNDDGRGFGGWGSLICLLLVVSLFSGMDMTLNGIAPHADIEANSDEMAQLRDMIPAQPTKRTKGADPE